MGAERRLRINSWILWNLQMSITNLSKWKVTIWTKASAYEILVMAFSQCPYNQNIKNPGLRVSGYPLMNLLGKLIMIVRQKLLNNFPIFRFLLSSFCHGFWYLRSIPYSPLNTEKAEKVGEEGGTRLLLYSYLLTNFSWVIGCMRSPALTL